MLLAKFSVLTLLLSFRRLTSLVAPVPSIELLYKLIAVKVVFLLKARASCSAPADLKKCLARRAQDLQGLKPWRSLNFPSLVLSN